MAGEFSNGYNDCGLFVNGVGNGAAFGDCTTMNDWANYNATFKAGLKSFALASMDATEDWWFWTWKVRPLADVTCARRRADRDGGCALPPSLSLSFFFYSSQIGNSSTSNSVEAPLWSYKLGLEQGWMPTDPREAVGKCAALGATNAKSAFPGTYSAWQTGGQGAGTIAGTAAATASQWPPTTLSGVSGVPMSVLPTYTPTSTISTLPPPTLTASVTQGDGWFDAKDTQGAMTQVAGCSYPNAWDSAGVVTPTAACPAGAAVSAAATEPPTRQAAF